MKNVILATASVVVLFSSCTKENAISSSSEVVTTSFTTDPVSVSTLIPELQQYLPLPIGSTEYLEFNLHYKPETINSDVGPITKHTCPETGNNCAKAKDGSLSVIEKATKTSLFYNINNGTTSNFFNGTEWANLFGYLTGTSILTSLQNGDLVMYEVLTDDGQALVASIPGLSPSEIQPNQVLFMVNYTN